MELDPLISCRTFDHKLRFSDFGFLLEERIFDPNIFVYSCRPVYHQKVSPNCTFRLSAWSEHLRVENGREMRKMPKMPKIDRNRIFWHFLDVFACRCIELSCQLPNFVDWHLICETVHRPALTLRARWGAGHSKRCLQGTTPMVVWSNAPAWARPALRLVAGINYKHLPEMFHDQGQQHAIQLPDCIRSSFI